MNNAANVSAGKPQIGGAIYRAPLGTALPKNATSALPEAYESVGYISDSGLVNSTSQDTNSVAAWGGDEVLSTVSNKTDHMQFTMIEAMNPVVLKTVYGSDNVTGDLTSGIVVHANSSQQESFVWVCDMILNGDVLKRIVVPDASVIEVGDVDYTDTDAIGYETTIACKPFSAWDDGDDTRKQGDTHREYIVRKPAASEEET